jgi:hypothetical protein
MLDRTIVLGTIAACMLATPIAAQAPATTTTAFDGTYVGVSRTLESTMEGRNTRGCLPSGQPGPLTIASGVARYPTFRVGTWEGSVNAQGMLVIHGQSGERIDAQIDGRGTVTGRSTGGCSYQMVWQKEGK